MRTPLTALLAALTVSACTAPPQAEDLELDDDELDWSQGYSAVPDAKPRTAVEPPRTEPEPEPQLMRHPERYDGPPRIAVGPYHRWAAEEFQGAATCPFEVQALGFPAVTVDGDVVVSARAEALSNSDGEDEVMHVTWRTVDTDAVAEWIQIFDGMDEGGWNAEQHAHCRGLWEGSKAKAAQINARLAEQSWRALEPLDIAIHDPHTYDYDGPSHADARALPARLRPVELTYVAGDAVVRVPGVRVLARTAADWWGYDDMCSREPHPGMVWVDRPTGAIAVELDHNSGACLCNSATVLHTLRWSDEVLAAIDRSAALRVEVEESE